LCFIKELDDRQSTKKEDYIRRSYIIVRDLEIKIASLVLNIGARPKWLTAFPGQRNNPVAIFKEFWRGGGWWFPEPVWKIWRKDKSLGAVKDSNPRQQLRL
jgi:hypothetical protein